MPTRLTDIAAITAATRLFLLSNEGAENLGTGNCLAIAVNLSYLRDNSQFLNARSNPRDKTIKKADSVLLSLRHNTQY